MTTDKHVSMPRGAPGYRSVEEYRQLLGDFCTLLQSYGLEVSAFRDPSNLFFSKLSPASRKSVLGHFRTYVDACEHVHAAGRNTLVNKTLLWRMFVGLKVRPESELLDMITDDDFIEIYNQDYVQVFRNPKFFTVCSYTLDDLLCRPWWELFFREQKVTDSILKVADSVFSGKSKGTTCYHLPPHAVDELDSPRLYQSVVENRFVAPLFDSSGRIAAIVNVIRGISCVSRAGATIG